MSLTKLQPGDPCVLEKPAPTEAKPDRVIRFRFVVADALTFPKRRGEKELIPVYRPIKRKKTDCNADHPDRPAPPQKIRWIERSKLRQLPS